MFVRVDVVDTTPFSLSASAFEPGARGIVGVVQRRRTVPAVLGPGFTTAIQPAVP